MNNKTYHSQVKVDTSNDGKTVTGHVVLTLSTFTIPWVNDKGQIEDQLFNSCVEDSKAPPGLPFKDESSPIGTVFGGLI